MSHHFKRPAGLRHVGVLAAGLMVAGLGLLTSPATMAAAPPVGTTISNQATASYRDGNGSQQISTSNSVVTVISQVGGYALTPAGDGSQFDNYVKKAAAGATVYMPYTLTNTGNGLDTFSLKASEADSDGINFTRIEIFKDRGDGLPESTTPLCSFAANACETTAVSVQAGDSYKFVVAYSLPTNATAGTWASNKGKIEVKPNAGSAWVSTYAQSTSDKSEFRTDTVELTTDAAFTVGKAIMRPAVSSGWPLLTGGPRGSVTTFTLSYANNGGATGNLYIKDALPAGLTYLPGQSWFSCGAVGSGDTSGTLVTPTGCSGSTEFKWEGQNVEAVIKNLAPGASGTLSFQVTVANSAAIGTSQTTNVAGFTNTTCVAGTIAGCSSQALSNTSEAAFNVTPVRRVRFNTQDTTAGTPADANDGMTSPRIVLGGFVKQTHVITNTGDAEDVFNLGNSDLMNFPQDAQFRWFAEGGTVPLVDTDGDGREDTGLLAAGASINVVLQITIPQSVTLPLSDLSAVMVAQSSADETASDFTYTKITSVIATAFDLFLTGGTTAAQGVGVGPGTAPINLNHASYTTPLVAGNTVVIPLTAVHYRGAEGSTDFEFRHSDSPVFPPDGATGEAFNGTLPAGWVVQYATAAVGCNGAKISSQTVGDAPSGSNYVVCITAPVNAPTGVQPIYVRFKNSTNTEVGLFDSVYLGVNVVSSSAYSMSLVSNGTGTVGKGNSVDYQHVLTNSGQFTCGVDKLHVTATLPANKIAEGWSTTIYLDMDDSGTVNAGDTLIQDGVLINRLLPSGDNAMFLVRVYAPGGANAGDSSVVTVRVSDVDANNAVKISPNGCGTVNVLNTTTVVTGTVDVLKKHAVYPGTCSGTSFPADLAAKLDTASLNAAPGDCVYYEVVATNNGVAPVRNVSITDAAPVYTTLEATPTACEPLGFGTGSEFGAQANLSTNIVTCRSSGDNTLNPGGNLTLRFRVQIRGLSAQGGPGPN